MVVAQTDVDVTGFARQVMVLDSANISGIDYDVSTRKMIVHFISGGVYLYHGIAPSTFGTIVASESVGMAFHKLVKRDREITYSRLR